MKKIRFLPYGYTTKNGLTVVEPEEARVIRTIFDNYIKGYSLKDIAEMLTIANIPYTEKTTVWDKARIARIIDNAKYLGTEEFAPIIEEDIFDDAARCKLARQRYTPSDTSESLGAIRNRVKCGKCGSPMCRKITGKKRHTQTWVCQNDECGYRMKIPDSIFLDTLNILVNRIIENQELLKPQERPKVRLEDEPANIQNIKQKIFDEIGKPSPSEDYIIDKVQDLINERYRTSSAEKEIRVHVLQRLASGMKPQDTFNKAYFLDLIDYIILDEANQIIVHTKTDTEIGERINKDGD